MLIFTLYPKVCAGSVEAKQTSLFHVDVSKTFTLLHIMLEIHYAILQSQAEQINWHANRITMRCRNNYIPTKYAAAFLKKIKI